MPSQSGLLYFQDRMLKSEQVEVIGGALGEMWTQDGILKQALFLGDYAKDRAYQAAWVLGVSACMSNDAHTLPRLKDALVQGLRLDDACQIALSLNSEKGALALTHLGVDWKTQTVHPVPRRFSGDKGELSYPNGALIDAHIEGDDRASRRYRSYIEPVNVLDMAALHQKSNFLQGIIEGGLDVNARVPSLAIGLSSGTVGLLPLLIVNGHWPLVERILEDYTLDQPQLDESLLALSMRKHIGFDGSNHQDEKLSLRLIGMGASLDAVHQFSDAAKKYIFNGIIENIDEGGDLVATARMWAISGVIKSGPHYVSEFMKPYIDDLPKASSAMPSYRENKDVSWTAWALNETSGVRFGETKPQYIQDIMTSEKPSDRQIGVFIDYAVKAATNGVFEKLDIAADFALPVYKEGLMSKDVFLGCIEDIANDEPCSSKARERFNDEVKMDYMASLLTKEDAAQWKEASSNWFKMLRMFKDQTKLSKEDDQALRMAYDTTLEIMKSAHIAPQASRPRRSL